MSADHPGSSIRINSRRHRRPPQALSSTEKAIWDRSVEVYTSRHLPEEAVGDYVGRFGEVELLEAWKPAGKLTCDLVFVRFALPVYAELALKSQESAKKGQRQVVFPPRIDLFRDYLEARGYSEASDSVSVDTSSDHSALPKKRKRTSIQSNRIKILKSFSSTPPRFVCAPSTCQMDPEGASYHLQTHKLETRLDNTPSCEPQTAENQSTDIDHSLHLSIFNLGRSLSILNASPSRVPTIAQEQLSTSFPSSSSSDSEFAPCSEDLHRTARATSEASAEIYCRIVCEKGRQRKKDQQLAHALHETKALLKIPGVELDDIAHRLDELLSELQGNV